MSPWPPGQGQAEQSRNAWSPLLEHDQHHAVSATPKHTQCGAANQAQGVVHQPLAVPAVGVHWVELGLNEHHDVPAAGTAVQVCGMLCLLGNWSVLCLLGNITVMCLLGNSFVLVML